MTDLRITHVKECGQIFFKLFLFVLLVVGSGCAVDISGVNEAEEALQAIPELTSLPTKVKPTSTPIPNYTPADALEIAAEVAANRALITPSPIPTIQPVEDKEYRFPLLLEEGTNFREVPGGVWYTTELTALEVQEFYLDDMIYYRWDYEIGEQGEGYFDIQFRKFEERYQLTVWENQVRGLTVISMMEVSELVAGLEELPTSLYKGKWPLIGNELGVKDDGGGIYTIDLPLSIVRFYYLTTLLDAGWLPLPAEREQPSTLLLAFVRDEEEISFLLEDGDAGTTVSWNGN